MENSDLHNVGHCYRCLEDGLMGKAKRITADLLRKHNACREQVELFEQHFPEGVVPTLKIADQFAFTFDFGWAAQNLLSPAARADYERVTAPALADYVYERVTAPALADYERVTAPALADYKHVTARTFVQLWRIAK